MSNRFSLIVPYEPYLACVSKLRGSVSVYCSGLAVFFFGVLVCGFIHNYHAVYGEEIIAPLPENINLARGLRFLRIFVAQI